jgi:predicted esterase
MLHGHNGGLDDLIPLGRLLGKDFEIVVPEAARGVYLGRELISHTWYGGWQLLRPESASFGDSLAQLEKFLYDVRARRLEDEAGPLVVIGYDQGAVLALTLTQVVPEQLGGVVAIAGALPELRGWTPPIAETGGVPILLVADPEDREVPETAIEETRQRLRAAGSPVAVEWMPGVRQLGEPVAAVVRGWFSREVLTDRATGQGSIAGMGLDSSNPAIPTTEEDGD